MITTGQIYNRVMKRLRDVPGTASQTYDDDTMLEIIQSTFDSLFDKYWWFEYLEPGATLTLDGTTGKPTPSFTTVTRFADMRAIWISTDSDPLPLAPRFTNPSKITRICVQPIVQPVTGSTFRILPITTTGDIVASYRVRPANFTALDDTAGNKIYLDDQLMILGVAWDYLNGTGINPMEEEKLKGKYAERLGLMLENKQIMDTAGSGYSGTLTEWSEF